MEKLPVIRWVNPAEDDIVWRYPNDEIPFGAVLVVEEYQVAVFFRDGKAYDVLGPGRHVLSTLNLPLLTKAYNLVYSETPFKATIIFVSMKQHKGRFGGQSQTRDLAPIKFHGMFLFRVDNPQLFVVEVVGGQQAYDTDSVNNFLRGYFNERVIASIAKYTLVDVYGNLDKVSAEVKLDLFEDFRRIGLELIDVKFEGIDTTPEYRERLFWIAHTGAATEVLRMDTVKAASKELGKSPGASLGAGMMIIPPLFYPPYPSQQPSAAPPAIPSATGTPPSQPPGKGIVCPKCGTMNPPGAKFCYNCGTPLTKKCPKCGNEVPLNANFCPFCGYRFTQ
ncbi:MAG: hypothetical protein DRJ35_00410 [Thermoprotei archaeon]|nr:MAG: hypothetical protein DRJ35_00410 [Thermoprotei archaeon]